MQERPSTKTIVLSLLGTFGGAALVLLAILWISSATFRPVGGDEPERPKPVHRPAPVAEPTEPTASAVASVPEPAYAPTAPAAAPPAVPAQPTVQGMVVVIDPGHQGSADPSLEPIGPGATEKKPKVAGGAPGESVINLAVGLKLRDLLQARGVKVFMTRTTENVNVANSVRAEIANNAHAALFIRIHCDGAPNSSTAGLSTLVPASNQWTAPIVTESRKAGEDVHRAVIAATGAADRGLKVRSDLSGFNYSKVPSVLVEMGFLSNPAEAAKLKTPSYQDRLASGMAEGVVAYLGSRAR